MSRLDAVMDWESFRPLLDAALDKPAQGPGGRPAHDRLKMFKALLVQRFYNLSDEQTEYQINDRLSFQEFIGWTLADKIPDGNTLWDCRKRQRRLVGLGFHEALIEAGADRACVWLHEPDDERILPALHWEAAQCGRDRLDQPDLQHGPL